MQDLDGSWRLDCAGCGICAEHSRRVFDVTLPCGHVVKVQMVGSAPSGARIFETPGMVPTVVVPAQRGHHVIRQVSGVRNHGQVVAVAVHGGSPPAPMSPPRGQGPLMTPHTVYRHNSAGTLEEGVAGMAGAPQASPQMSSRSAASGAGPAGHSGGYPPGPPGQQVHGLGVQGPAKGRVAALPSQPSADVVRGEVAHRQGPAAEAGGQAPSRCQKLLDCRGSELHKDSEVILLVQPRGERKPHQVKVRAKIVATHLDMNDASQQSGDVQVLVTYVDPSERKTALQFPTESATTFGDAERIGNCFIKWRASLCRVGKRFIQ